MDHVTQLRQDRARRRQALEAALDQAQLLNSQLQSTQALGTDDDQDLLGGPGRLKLLASLKRLELLARRPQSISIITEDRFS